MQSRKHLICVHAPAAGTSSPPRFRCVDLPADPSRSRWREDRAEEEPRGRTDGELERRKEEEIWETGAGGGHTLEREEISIWNPFSERRNIDKC